MFTKRYAHFHLLMTRACTAKAMTQQQITEYPLISKAKSSKSFRDMLVSFFESLVGLLHETDILYKDVDLMDNLHAWLASMSSSSLRPFRHTATTISLSVQSGLVEVAGILDRRISNIEQQLQTSKKSKNKAKTAEIQRTLGEANEHRKTCSDAIQSFFDTVFVHRYRDVDPKIRTECVEALGKWIWTLPTVFLEPGYLRYLGWMLSDTNGVARQEVLKQLHKLFRRDAQQLGHFIDRFRPRLNEIATLDSEVSVRVAAISVIDTLRAAALLEPSEIDAIGKLIFDSEIRIRKAVVGFFVACVGDVLQGKIEGMGGSDALDELDNVDDDDFESPRREWADIKSLAETLAIYESQIEDAQQNSLPLAIDMAADLLETTAPDSRISLATQVLYDKIPEVKNWEILAGYLLFDHTTSAKSRSKSKSRGDSPETAFKKAVAPTAAEEAILLDVLSSAIKTSLSQTADTSRSKKQGHRTEVAETHEDIALELATVIPKLLNKFGAEPGTAATVLKLEHCLNLNAFQQLRQDSTKYEKLLDEISTQFNRHDDKRVISEAATALLHARQHDELEEIADNKLSLLWETVIDALHKFDETCELSVRGNLALTPLREISTVLMKISKLASISDCVDILEAPGPSGNSSSSAIHILSTIVHRGKYEPQEDEIDDAEDEIVSYAIKACQFYFMWKTRIISKLLSSGASLPDSDLDRLSVLRQSYRRHLIETLSSRAAIDQTRLFATGSLCDLHLTFATLRPVIQRAIASGATATAGEKAKTLIQEIEPGIVPELISIFDGAERQYAKRAKKDKILNEPAEDEDPMAEEDEEDEEDEDEGLSLEERQVAALKSEKALCELTAKIVLAIMAKLVDNTGPHPHRLRRRILRNHAKLGNNFKEVVAYLNEEKSAKRSKRPFKVGAADRPQQAALSLEVIPPPQVHGEEEDVFDDVEPEEGSREDLRRRGLLDEDAIEDDEELEPVARADDDAEDEVLGD